MKNRDDVIDIAKGIGILLMILGHCNGLPYLLRNFIFSFHMPLFFIFSGYFYKPKPVKDIFIHGTDHLVKPYLITSFFCILLCIIAGRYGLAKEKMIGVLMSNGGLPQEMFGANLPYIGPNWFLLALFWCKIFYAYLNRKTNHCLFYSFIISTIALIVGKYIVNLPFGILTGFCGMVFYGMGDFWKNKMGGLLKTPCFIVGLFVWAFCVWKGRLELAAFECKFYPIAMFAAFIGTYATYLVSKHIPDFLHSAFLWIGQNTLLILCYHTVCWVVLLDTKIYLFLPNAIELNAFSSSVLMSALSLGLPILHRMLFKHIKRAGYSRWL